MHNNTLCLNMIVKNESRIILRLLDSVSQFIDSFCICDTGSTDNTIELITNYFKDKKIKGKISHEPFQNFEYNRTFALNDCQDVPNSDYILLLDADMKFEYKLIDVSPQEFKNKLVHDAYFISQGNDSFNYKNVRIVRNRHGFSYWGVTHEYIKTDLSCVNGTFKPDEIFINDIGDGGCKSDKVERDINLLKNGLIENPNNDRYTFYLANSYKDKGNYEDAIEYYKKRIEIGGWIEEIWVSHYSIGKCYQKMGRNAEAIFHWLEAYNRYPKRIENIYEIIKYYRLLCNYNLAYHFYVIADFERKKQDFRDFLFTEIDVYDYRIDYELSIIGYYFNSNCYDLKRICMNILKYKTVEKSQYLNVISNYKFYTDSIIDFSVQIHPQNRLLLQSIGKNIIQCENMTSSTPSMSQGHHDNELIVCVRYVNYKIGEKGEYINSKNITTINIIAIIDITFPIWIIKKQTVLDYNKEIDDLYIGVEDVRILRRTIDNEVSLSYSSNRCLLGNMIVEHGIIDTELSSCIESQFLSFKDSRDVEKNWVLFNDGEKFDKCIYEWYPLTIGNIITGGQFEPTIKDYNVPAFFKSLRGSTNGIIINNEIWFIAHIVSYEDRRYYYHVMVVIDRNNYHLKSYTPLWTFEKQKVEYTLGMVLLNNNFLIGYSTMDNTTKFTSIPKRTFDSMMIIQSNN